MSKELWLPAADYEKYFLVSNLGRVKRLSRMWVTGRGTPRFYKGKIINPSIIKGYSCVTTYVNGKTKNILLHRVIAKTFIPNPDNKPCVNHINGVKSDNKITNLEWVTYSENLLHAHRTGLKFYKGGRDKKFLQLDLSGNVVKQWDRITDAHNAGYERSAIIRCAKGRQKTSYGFIWKYAS